MRQPPTTRVCLLLMLSVVVAASRPARGDIEFWLSSNQQNGCYHCLQPDGTLAESIEVYPDQPFTLTIWATLGTTDNLTAISLWLDSVGEQVVEANAVWMFNPELDTAQKFRHQITVASDPADFASADLPPAGEQGFPFCNNDGCAYVDVAAADFFGAASIGVPFDGRTGLGVGAAAKAAGDTGYVAANSSSGQPELWKIGLIEFLPIRTGTTTLQLLEGDPVLFGSPEPFSFYDLQLDVTLLPDYNRDGEINLADYTIWRDTLGESNGSCNGSDYACADGDGNNVVDIEDYELWKQYFGVDYQKAVGLTMSVPEPESRWILLPGILILGITGRLEKGKHVCPTPRQ